MKTSILHEIEQSVQQLYALVQQRQAEKTAISILHIGNDCTVVAYGDGSATPIHIWRLEIGAEITAQQFFRHYPPTTGEVEEAIQNVEDEVMTLSKLLPFGSSLYTSDQGIREIVLLADRSPEHAERVVLARTDMEQVFGRLAAIVFGRPVHSDHLPATGSFAARLLILREVMFHLKFMDITSVAPNSK